MLGIVAAIVLFIAFLINAADLSTNDVFTSTNVMLIGLALLACTSPASAAAGRPAAVGADTWGGRFRRNSMTIDRIWSYAPGFGSPRRWTSRATPSRRATGRWDTWTDRPTIAVCVT